MSDQMQSEIAELNTRFDEIEDPRQCYALVQERIRRYRAAGRQVPDDLTLMERRLMAECMAQSQGR